MLIPSTVFIGASLGIGLMFGAISSHIAIIGIESKGDGGQLFILAIIVLISCVITCVLHLQQGLNLLNKIIKSKK